VIEEPLPSEAPTLAPHGWASRRTFLAGALAAA
jgi:hypothetical protein